MQECIRADVRYSFLFSNKKSPKTVWIFIMEYTSTQNSNDKQSFSAFHDDLNLNQPYLLQLKNRSQALKTLIRT